MQLRFSVLERLGFQIKTVNYIVLSGQCAIPHRIGDYMISRW